jgi:amino acid permease
MKEAGKFWRTAQPLVGSVIGVGIFGLPFVFAQAGFFIGLGHLVVVGLINLVVLMVYSDIIMNTEGNSRLTGIVERYMGKGWSTLATIFLFGGSWGAMVAYIIVGGEFLQALLAGLFGGGLLLYQLTFFVITAALLIGGLGFITRIEVIFVFVLLLILFLILVGSLPYVEIEHLTEVNPRHWFAPFGVVLFAFGGLAAIPEMADILGRDKRKLRRVVLMGMGIISLVYIAFSGVVVAVTGKNTSEEAILGLGAFVGDWVTVLGSIVGLFAVFTSFLLLGISITDTLVYDYKQRYLVGWAIAVSVPLFVFLIGARSFIGVIGFTGGILGGLTGLLVLLTYVRAKNDVCTPKNCLQFPSWIIYLCASIFLFGVVMTIVGL